MLLREFLGGAPFTLSMSCSFFGYFAHTGVLLALEESGLRPAKVTGASAGAVVAALYGAGYGPRDLEALFRDLQFGDAFRLRPRLYGGFPVLGLFQQRLDDIEDRVLQENYPRLLEECRVPVAVTVYDATARRGKVLRKGRAALAVVASAAVPVFMHALEDDDGHRLLDGGLAGDVLGVAGADAADRVLVVNLFVRAFLPETPQQLPDSVTVDFFGVPFVTPLSLHTAGPRAHKAAYDAMRRALDQPLPAATGARRIRAPDADDVPRSSGGDENGPERAPTTTTTNNDGRQQQNGGGDGSCADDDNGGSIKKSAPGEGARPASWWDLLRS